MNFQVGPEVIASKGEVKYLGMMLDTKLTFWQHIKYSSERAAKITTSLSRLMANVGGPTACKRKLLMSITHNVLLYGCEIWADALNVKKYRNRMAAVQRLGALRVASCYRTVSEPAVLVIAGIVPIDLLAAERKYVYERKVEVGVESATAEAKEITIQKWQARRDSDERGRWTAKLIKDIATWKDRKHGQVNYYVTQFLTGHGYFNAFLYKIGKAESPSCQYGDHMEDDVYHTFFNCIRWLEERRMLEHKIGNINPDNIVEKMLVSQQNWNEATSFIEKVLKTKKQDEQNLYT